MSDQSHALPAPDSVEARVLSVILKLVLVALGLGVGAFAGLVIALFTGLLNIAC